MNLTCVSVLVLLIISPVLGQTHGNSTPTVISDPSSDEAGRTKREIQPKMEITLKLTKMGPNTYATEPFVAPEGLFKVQLKGVDSNGNQIQRLISTAVESVEPSRLLIFEVK